MEKVNGYEAAIKVIDMQINILKKENFFSRYLTISDLKHMKNQINELNNEKGIKTPTAK